MQHVPAQPTPVLVAESGPLAGGRVAVQPLPFAIGRSATNHLVLPDTSVSRAHARLDARDGRWVLEDLDSANGTLLNRQPLHGVQTLHDGDLIAIGESIFLFVRVPAAEPAAVTRPHRSLKRRSPLPALAGLLLVFAAALLIGLQLAGDRATLVEPEATPPAFTLPALPTGLPPLPTGLPALPTGLPDLFPLPPLPGFPQGGTP